MQSDEERYDSFEQGIHHCIACCLLHCKVTGCGVCVRDESGESDGDGERNENNEGDEWDD